MEARSSQRGITGTMENALKVKLTSPPVEGAANEQLIEVISEATGFNKNRIRIIRGASSKRKLVEIEGATEIR